MNAFHIAYNLLLTGVGTILLPPIWQHVKCTVSKKEVMAQRLGYDDPTDRAFWSGKPRLWIHAVSVGEVKVAEAIVSALDQDLPQARILLTTTTTTGQEYARTRFGRRAIVKFAPIDLLPAINRFLRAYRPDLLVCMETEIWPNWLISARRLKIPTVFLNGRISSRSIRAYTLLRPLIKPALETVAVFSMISDADARRIITMGAPASRIQVNGNAKMDSILPRQNGAILAKYRQCFSISEKKHVMVAGSIRGGEVEKMLYVYRALVEKIPDLLFVIAPRHLENTHKIKSLADSRGIPWQCRSELGEGRRRNKGLLILDTIGELRHVYSVASVVFCGASLVPLGGQDILEPAAWGRPVLYGPSMEDFDAARQAIEAAGGGICVSDEQELAQRCLYLLQHPDESRRMGQRALLAVRSCQGAAKRHARVIRRFL